MIKAAGDVGSIYSAMLVIIGERLGLYKAMAELGPTSSAELADKTDTSERYVRGMASKSGCWMICDIQYNGWHIFSASRANIGIGR